MAMVSLDIIESNSHLLFKISPSSGYRMPIDLCCVLDISGSMGQTVVTDSENSGLSVLDVAKHAVKTIIETLNEFDKLAVVWFNHESGVLFPLTIMNEVGKQHAKKLLSTLTDCGGTDIWKGLHKGLIETSMSKKSHIMLLSDGQTSNRNTIIPNLESHRNRSEKSGPVITTFGFGYNIDSEILLQIASIGGSNYSFIPDAGFVGTIFVNAISNIFVTMAKNVYLVLDIEGAKIQKIYGQLPLCSGGRVFVGSLQWGQSRDILIEVDSTRYEHVTANICFEDFNGEFIETECVEHVHQNCDISHISEHLNRYVFIEEVSNAFVLAKDGDFPKARGIVGNISMNIINSASFNTNFSKSLLEDVNGQVAMALSGYEQFSKWGIHYIPSLILAHKTQQCNNFKDPGVQHYGGEVFRDLQNKADEIFNILPPPVTHAGPQTVVRMQSLNDRYAG